MRHLGWTMAATTAAALLVGGCSSSGGGSGGAGGAAGSGGGAAETFGFDFALYEVDADAPDLKGAPIADALVALDLPSGERQDLATSAEGKVHLEVPSDVEWLTWTVAKTGRIPVRTYYRATIAEVQAHIVADGEIFSIMDPTPEPVTPLPTVNVTLNATVPFCSSVEWSKCGNAGSQVWAVGQSSQPLLVVAYSTDEQGCPVELRELTLPDTLTDQTVDLVFDGSNPAVPERFDATLQLPEDPTSLLNTEAPYLDGLWPWVVNDPTLRLWGGSCNQQLDADAGTIDVTVAYFPKNDRDLMFVFGVWPGTSSGTGLNPASEHWFGLSSPGPGTYEVLDIPVLSSPTGSASRSSTFSSQPIAGATQYSVEVSAPNPNFPYPPNRSLWMVQSWSHQDIVLPALPAGYDATAEWGSGTGRYRLIACDGWDQYLTTDLAKPAAHPEWMCGYGAPINGPILE
jgi:hypothetical protein